MHFGNFSIPSFNFNFRPIKVIPLKLNSTKKMKITNSSFYSTSKFCKSNIEYFIAILTLVIQPYLGSINFFT